MRLAARRRGQWMGYGDLESWESRLLFQKGSITEVTRLGEGEPIILVPGLAGGARLLAPLAARLARRHEVILYTLRGERLSPHKQRSESIADYANDLAGLIDSLGLERPTIFGVSFGGAIALELAVEHPNRVGSLVVQGVEDRFQSGLGSSIAREVLERFPLPSGNRFLNQFFNLLHGGKPEAGPLAEFVVERCWETDQAAMARRLVALETFDVSHRLWRIDVPTLVLAGTRDVIVPWERQRSLAASIPGARFEAIEGAGHIGFLTHKADVERHVRRLLLDRQRSLC